MKPLMLYLIAAALLPAAACSRYNPSSAPVPPPNASEGISSANISTTDPIPANPTIRAASAEEIESFHRQAAEIPAFIAMHAPGYDTENWTLEALDEAFKNWVTFQGAPQPPAEKVILSLGAAFGNYCVEHLDMKWVYVEDDLGRDFAVRNSQFGVISFPFSMIVKRVENGSHSFITPVFGTLKNTIRDKKTSQPGITETTEAATEPLP